MLVMVVFFIAFRWIHLSTPLIRLFLLVLILLLMPTLNLDRKSGSAGMPRPISYAVFCLKKKKSFVNRLKELQDKNIQLIWQCGSYQFEEMNALTAELDMNGIVLNQFINEM